MTNQEKYLLPFSIIAAALLIVGAIIYSAGLKNVDQPGKAKEKSISNGVENVLPISEKDHPRGNPEAPVKIIEFSDMECPFCKRFHQTMLQVMDEYEKDGKVVWVYRHYPIEQLHSKAKKSALAAECAAELGGNNGFWNYLDKYFEITPSNNLINLSDLPKIAEDIGLDRSRFEECLESGRYDELIKEQTQDALNSGSRGTPYSILINKNGEKSSINGALPIDDFKDQDGTMQKGVRALIEEALK